MSVLGDLLLKGVRLTLGHRRVLGMISERGGSVEICLTESAVGKAGREGVKALDRLGLINLVPILGRDEYYQMSITDRGRTLVDGIVRYGKAKIDAAG